ncbi:MAG: hypothetical protein IJV25_01525 [Prevotella sp.]|nr:hypothetical protein [Prevotella sp.]
MMVTILSMTLVSCDKKDPTSSDSKGIMQEIQRYKWTGQSIEEEVYSYGTATYTQTWTVYFINDSQGVMHWTAVDRDTALGTSRDEDDIEFYYEIKGNTIHLYGGSNFVFEYYDGFLVEGETIFSPSSLGSSDYAYLQNYLNDNGENNGGSDGRIDTEVFFINDNEILMGVNYDESSGAYQYVLQFGFGVNDKKAYDKGLTKLTATIWADNGSFDGYKSSNFGKKKKLELDVYPGSESYYGWEWLFSKDKEVTLHYDFSYYNSNNGQTYYVTENHIVKLKTN